MAQDPKAQPQRSLIPHVGCLLMAAGFAVAHMLAPRLQEAPTGTARLALALAIDGFRLCFSVGFTLLVVGLLCNPRYTKAARQAASESPVDSMDPTKPSTRQALTWRKRCPACGVVLPRWRWGLALLDREPTRRCGQCGTWVKLDPHTWNRMRTVFAFLFAFGVACVWVEQRADSFAFAVGLVLPVLCLPAVAAMAWLCSAWLKIEVKEVKREEAT